LSAKRRARSNVDRRGIREAAAAPSPAPRTNRVLAAGLAVYLTILATMVAFESYTFVLKSSIIPFLLVAAVLSQRFSGFVNDWAIFLGAVVLFDSLRSAEFAVTTQFQLPMYAGYAIEWERWLCGGVVAPVSAQQLRAALADPLWIDRFFVLIHASHFLFFLLFGFLLWYVRREAFRTYAAAMVALLYLALLIQFLVPTLPPWLAARDFALLPPTERLINSVYNVHLPTLAAMFDINPIAAMPSLHAAMPALCALLALHYVGRPGIVVAIYALAAGAAAVYLGEHYLVDVVAGWVLAAAVYAGARRWGAPAAATPLAADRRAPVEHLAIRPIAVGVVLIGLAFGFGQVATAWLAPLPVTVAFVKRELVGRSPVANYLLGRIAFDAGDYEHAKARFVRALDDLPQPAEQDVIRSFLVQCAQRTDGRAHPGS
jgi:membrane-associated phospholipid phosphatase